MQVRVLTTSTNIYIMEVSDIKVGCTYYTRGGVLLVNSVKHVLTASGPEYFLECSDHNGNVVYVMPECVIRLYS